MAKRVLFRRRDGRVRTLVFFSTRPGESSPWKNRGSRGWWRRARRSGRGKPLPAARNHRDERGTTPWSSLQRARRERRKSAFIAGRSTASTTRCGEGHFRSAVATPASGPAPAITSATISNSRHASCGGPEIMSCSGESARSVSICRRQSGWPSISRKALSRPMRDDLPPARRTALWRIVRQSSALPVAGS